MLSTGSIVDTRKSDLFRHFEAGFNRKFRSHTVQQNLGEWVQKAHIILDGNPFSFDRHEYLKEPYYDMHPFQVEMKAAQLGLTTKAALRAFHGGITNKYPRGTLYLFPNKTDVTDFSKARMTPIVEENQESIRQWMTETDTANLKQIGTSFLYLRGMQSRVGLKSIPVDFIIFDELDEAPQIAIDMAMKRMAHSDTKDWLKLSNPTLPEFGIDAAFAESDQRYWLLTCPACGHDTCLEDTFPSCLLELSDGRVIRACEKCHTELNPSIGRWVNKKEYPDVHGYHYSELFSNFVNPKDILHDFRTAKNLTNFYNLTIGIPWVEATHRISIEAVYAICGDLGIAESDPGPTSMGVDQGKDLHVVIGRQHPDRAGRIIHLGVHREWDVLDQLMRRFHVYRCVIDGNPDSDKARTFASHFPGKVFLNYYSEHQKGITKWNEADWTVTENRTESLDYSGAQILGRGPGEGSSRVILPRRDPMVEEFAKHLHAIAKRLEEEEETGSKRYVYVNLGPPTHFRHAFNYECIARSTFTDLVFPELLT